MLLLSGAVVCQGCGGWGVFNFLFCLGTHLHVFIQVEVGRQRDRNPWMKNSRTKFGANSS